MPLGGKDQSAKNASFQVRTERYPFDGRTTHNVEIRMPKRSRRHTTGRRPGWSGRRCCTLAIGLPPKRWGPAPEQKPPPMAVRPPSVGCGNAKPTAVCRGICYPRLPTPPCGKPALLSHRAGFPRFTPLFVIIRARRRTNHQTLHSLSRQDPIPLTGCPSLRHTVVPGNAKLTKQKHPDRISPAKHYRFPHSLGRDSPNTQNHYQFLSVTRSRFW